MNEQKELDKSLKRNNNYKRSFIKERGDIKQQAKHNFHKTYGLCIGAFILFVIVGNPFNLFYNLYNTVANILVLNFYDASASAASITAVDTNLGMSIARNIIYGIADLRSETIILSSYINDIWTQTSLVFSIFLLPPVFVGYSGFCAKIYRGEQTSIKDMFRTGFDNYWRKVGGILWMQLFIFLWSLLFLIPGMIKSFAYFMTPYILADTKNVTAKQALNLSKRMTYGYKGDIFVMQLSFIGWQLLSMFTLGILGALYVYPYMYTSLGGMYEELKQNAILNGTVLPEELE